MGRTAPPRTPSEGSAARFRRPGWREPRLLVGLALILVAITGVIGTVRLLNTTQQYLVASHDISPGTPVSRDDFTVVEAGIRAGEDPYLRADADLAPEAIAVQRMQAGRLIPQEAIGAAGELDLRPITVVLDSALSASARAGDHVDVWVAEPGEKANSYRDPRVILEDVELAAITEGDAGLAARSQSKVEMLVPEEDVQAVVKAITEDARITVVGHPGGGS